MAQRETSYRANIGSSSLILIFIVLCLVTFGMLSLSSAKSDWNLANRGADAVTEYYRADGEAEDFYAMVLNQVKEACIQSPDPELQRTYLQEALGKYYREETGIAAMEVSMDHAQALYLELLPDFSGSGNISVLQWKVIQTEDYEIDRSMPVWNGAENHK